MSGGLRLTSYTEIRANNEQEACNVAGSFASAHGAIGLYGQADGDAVHVLGLHVEPNPHVAVAADLTSGLTQAMQTFSVNLADWCRCAIIEPGQVGDYLRAIAAT